MAIILLVDDQPAERRLLYHALKSHYEVLEAGDRATALGVLGARAVELVVLDMHLPPSPDTVEEGRRLRRAIHDDLPLVPVVVVTGDSEPELRLEMIRDGVADFFVKPVDTAVLRVVIDRALMRARLERELQRRRPP